MKIIPAIILCFGFSFYLQGQDIDQNNTNEAVHQLGINVTSFIENFFVLSGNNADAGPYGITYKRVKNNKAIRIGFAGRLNISNDTQPGETSRRNENNLLQVRVGYEWQNEISKRWIYTLGIDIIGEYHKSINISNNGLGDATTSNLRYGGGFGPNAGIQFKIRDRIFLATETSLIYNYAYEEFSQTFESFPELNIVPTNISSHDIQIVLPSAIFFIVSF